MRVYRAWDSERERKTHSLTLFVSVGCLFHRIQSKLVCLSTCVFTVCLITIHKCVLHQHTGMTNTPVCVCVCGSDRKNVREWGLCVFDIIGEGWRGREGERKRERERGRA